MISVCVDAIESASVDCIPQLMNDAKRLGKASIKIQFDIFQLVNSEMNYYKN